MTLGEGGIPPPGGPADRAAERSMPIFRRISWLSVAGTASKPLTLVTTLVVARALGPELLGELTAAQALLPIGFLLTDLGITVLAIEDIVRAPSRLSQVTSMVVTVQACASLLFGLGLLAVSAFLPLPHHSAFLLLLALPILPLYAVNAAFALQAMDDMARVAIARLLAVVITSGATIAVVLTTRSPNGPAILIWSGTLVTDILTVAWLRRRHGLRWARHSLRDCLQFLRRGASYFQISLLTTALLSVSTLSLAVFESAHSVGEYSAAWNLSINAALIATLVTDATFPEMVRRYHRSLDHFRSLADRLVVLMLRPAFAGATFVTFAARPLVHALVGNRFAASVEILRVLIWLVPALAISLLVGFLLIASGAQRTVRNLRLCTAAIFVIGCPLGAAFGGPIAVSAVMLSGQVLEMTLLSLAAYRRALLTSPARWLGEVEYVVIPALALFLLQLLWGETAFVILCAAWLLAIGAIEARRRFATIRLVRELNA